MYSTTRVYLRDDNGDKFFGEGPCHLLNGIERTGSLRAAAEEMEMAYTKALRLLRHAEATLGFPLTERTIGGKGGGGSRLTPQAKEFVQKYETFRDACRQTNEKLYRQIFTKAASPVLACVLMASGESRRFGDNKLLAPFHGEPLICRILAATDSSLFARRVVVTRHSEITKLCGGMGIPTVLHSFPYRSDTVRLGLEALDDNPPDGCMFCPCDQPFLSKDTIENMIQAFMGEPEYIYRLSWNGTPGSPLIFPRKYFAELKHLPQGKGGSCLLQSYPEQVRYIEAASHWELKDIDTREDLEMMEKNPMGKQFFSP